MAKAPKGSKAQSKAFVDAARELGGTESIDEFNSALRAVAHIRSGDRDDEHYKSLIGPAPAWMHLLSPDWQAWREKEILRGRDPDAHIEKELRKAGQWPEAGKPKKPAKKVRKAAK